MRKESLVNAHTRTLRAAGRTGNADWLQEVEQLPEPTQDQEVVGLAEILKGGVELTTRTQSGSPAVIRVPHSILAVLVTIALALVAGGVWLVSSITSISKDVGYVREQQVVIGRFIETETAYVSAHTNRVNFMVGLLSKADREELYEYDRQNPMPPRPEAPRLLTPREKQ